MDHEIEKIFHETCKQTTMKSRTSFRFFLLLPDQKGTAVLKSNIVIPKLFHEATDQLNLDSITCTNVKWHRSSWPIPTSHPVSQEKDSSTSLLELLSILPSPGKQWDSGLLGVVHGRWGQLLSGCCKVGLRSSRDLPEEPASCDQFGDFCWQSSARPEFISFGSLLLFHLV